MINYKHIQNAVLVVTSLLIIAGISEIVMRINYASEHGNSERLCLQGDEKLIYRFKANFEKCKTNGQGYADYDYPQEKLGKRLVIIGDSVAFGQGVPFGKSFGKLLEKKLNDVFQSAYEVVVLAVPGYSTSQEIVLLKDEVFQYNPDLIVIAYHLNDPAHPLYHNADGHIGMYFRKPVSYALFYLKRLMFRAFIGIKALQLDCPKKPFSLFLHCVHWSDVKKSFHEIMALADNKSTPVVFAFLPLFVDPADAKGLDELYERLIGLTEENGAQSVNLMEPFRGYDMKSVRVLDDPWHPNERGHQIIAEKLFSYFMNNKILISDIDVQLNEDQSQPGPI